MSVTWIKFQINYESYYLESSSNNLWIADIDDCNPDPCENEGVCKDGVFSHTCTCATGFTGDNCEVNIDDCIPDPCKNKALCEDADNDFTCKCSPGYEGKLCEKS